MKTNKIINVMSHTPAYELFWNDPRPDISWDTPDGKWVGVWGKDWAELIGMEMLKLSDEFQYEVWQPDLRADRKYTHVFPDNLVRKLLPAEERVKFDGFRSIRFVTSRDICNDLLIESKKNRIILHLNGIDNGISRSIFSLSLECPIVAQFLGQISVLPRDQLKFRKNLLGKLLDVQKYFALRKSLREADATLCVNIESKQDLAKYVDNEICIIPIGIDFNFWKPRCGKHDARRNLGLLNDKFILLSSSRLNSLKQVDKMIDVLLNLDKAFDFLYIVTGHGDHDYERYLANKGETLIRKGKLKFVGFLPEEDLINYYAAADLFVITSRSEGAPVSAIKALAMELPVFSTDTGYIAELLAGYDVGRVVSISDYVQWERNLREILHGRQISAMARRLAKTIFHWSNVAAQYLNLYKRLYDDHYGVNNER